MADCMQDVIYQTCPLQTSIRRAKCLFASSVDRWMRASKTGFVVCHVVEVSKIKWQCKGSKVMFFGESKIVAKHLVHV